MEFPVRMSEIPLIQLIADEYSFIINEGGDDSEAIKFLREAQKTTLDLFENEMELLGQSQIVSGSSTITAEFLRLHAYSSLVEMWNTLNRHYPIHQMDLSDDHKALLNTSENWAYHFQDLLSDYKSRIIDPTLFQLNQLLPSLFTDGLYPISLQSIGLAPTDYNFACITKVGGNIYDQWKQIEHIELVHKELKEYSGTKCLEAGRIIRKYLGINSYDFNRIPKINMGEDLRDPVFKEFATELDQLDALKKAVLYNGHDESPIKTGSPKVLKSFFELLRHKELIQIDDSNVSMLVRVLFDIPTKYFPRYPFKAPEFKISSDELGIDLKVLIKRLIEDQIIQGAHKDIADLVTRLFDCKGLSSISIQNALKPSSGVLFKNIKDFEYKSIIENGQMVVSQ